jgi:hypothetical protein
MNRAPQSLTKSLNSDVTHYAVLVIYRGEAYFAERKLEDSCSRSQTVEDILTGELGPVAKVFAFNPVEHVCDDVTEEIAVEVANSVDPTQPISEPLHSFIWRNAGEGYVRGLRIAEHTFRAA